MFWDRINFVSKGFIVAEMSDTTPGITSSLQQGEFMLK